MDSIRNEYYQENTANVGQIANVGETNSNYQLHSKLPDYTPYPALHPTEDPHQGAGFINPQEPCYLKDKESESTYDDLINRVLANKYCRKILKKLLVDEDEAKIVEGFETGGFETRGGFKFDSETIRSIIIYCLCGLLLLCILELVFKIGYMYMLRAGTLVS
jgi:hypothetical protein